MRPLSLLVLLICNLVACTSETGQEIIFGFFGNDLKQSGDGVKMVGDAESDKLVEAMESSDIKETNSDMFMEPNFIVASHANVRGDRLNELKHAEKLHIQRFQGVDQVDGRLKLRLGKDHYMGLASGYSMEALGCCLNYLELPQKEKEKPEIKKRFLNSLFASGTGVIDELKNSFLHPICYDFMKYMGDTLEERHVTWMTRIVPEALYENYELMTTLTDYSTIDFMGLEIRKYSTMINIDFLSIPNFLKSVSKSTLVMMLSSVFEPSKHWDILRENVNIEEFISCKEVVDNPRNYPFLTGFMPEQYRATAEGIVQTIRSNGLTPPILSALLAYIQESNDLVQIYMTEIATTWADIHKNSHLTASNSKEANEEFCDRVSGALTNILYLRDQRMLVDDLMKDLEMKTIPAHPTIIKLVPDWFKHLKMLIETPFSFLMRNTFATRNQLLYQAPIHPDDVDNCVPLPRLTGVGISGFYVAPHAAYTFSPFLWSSLWRNVFTVDGESWREDEQMNLLAEAKDLRGFEDKMRERGGYFIYQDSKSYNGNDLIGAWMKLSPILIESFQTGKRFVRFLTIVSSPAMPKDVQVPPKMVIERKVLLKKMKIALKEVKCIDENSEILLKFNYQDSEEVTNLIIEKSSKNQENIARNGLLMKIEEQCKRFMSSMENRSESTCPFKIFSALRRIETLFGLLGKDLKDLDVKFMGESLEIQKFLALHGRALSRDQISRLLKFELGRAFLKSNQAMLKSVSDYSQFDLKDFNELFGESSGGFGIEKIRLNLATIDTSIKFISLMKCQGGVAAVDDPLSLVFSLGIGFWSDLKSIKSFLPWELFNPLILAYDPEMTTTCKFDYHITGFKGKLNDTALLDLVVIFLTKWVIAQDWYVFMYHVALRRNLIGPSMTNRLIKGYEEYLESEMLGRSDAIAWMHSIDSARGTSESVLEILAGLSTTFESFPLTRFRELINQSKSEISSKLAAPFKSAKHSNVILGLVESVLMTRFKEMERSVWLARLRILSRFTSEGVLSNEDGEAERIKTNFNSLGLFDGVIYKWALELEGVSVEDIFRGGLDNVENGRVYIDLKSRVGIIPGTETEITKSKSNSKSKSKNKSKNKKK